MRRCTRDRRIAICMVAWFCLGCGSASDSSHGSVTGSTPCDRYKDAALLYTSCSPAEVAYPTMKEACVSDAEVARRGPLKTLDACADNLAGMTHDCIALDVLRQAYRSGDDTVVFDYLKKTGKRPGCQCDPIDPRFRAPPTQFETTGEYQCAALLVRPDGSF
jgi:hypothetical protein